MRQFAILYFALTCFSPSILGAYDARWDSLDSRPLPSWYDEAKVGIFIHWGVFSVPSFGSEWFWSYWNSGKDGNKKYKSYADYMNNNYPPEFTYQEFAKEFTAEFFNATEWANLFKKSGAKYVVLTSKHHEGFTLWPSQYSYSWNAKDIGPHRDIVAELSSAVREAKLTFGLYHSMMEWYHPLYLAAKNSRFKDKTFVNKTFGELYELVNTYKPSIIWSDGTRESKSSYWKPQKFLAWLYNESPVKNEVVVNDRWGHDVTCRHGDFLTCTDRYQPGSIKSKKWENAMTLDKKSWGFRRNAKLSDYLTIQELLKTMAKTVAYGGNILINVGPTKDGIITPIFEERLTQLGSWLEINGEAIYSTKPWNTSQNDSLNANVYYTQKAKAVFAILLEWPRDNNILLGSAGSLFQTENTTVELLGNEKGYLKWTATDGRVNIRAIDKAVVKSKFAWILKILS